MPASNAKRQELIVATLIEAFEPLMKADAEGFRTKFRKMAADPFAFYRGSACLFYADMGKRRDHRADDRTSRVWIHGDLHAENFGTYMNSEGVLVFDVNDFDEAYLGHFTWDLRRFVASLALMGWQKALPEDDIRRLSRTYLDAYVDQVRHYVKVEEDEAFALRLDNTDGAVHEVLVTARMCTRVEMLDDTTEVVDHERRFARGAGVRELSKTERGKVERAFKRYLTTLSDSKRQQQAVFYDIKDVVGRSGFGIGSAGLPAYNILIEGFNQALENDVVLSMKQANVPAVSRIVDHERAAAFFENEGHRTVVSQRELQVHTDPFLGWTTVDKVGYVVAEVSPYEADLDWSEISEPEEIEPVVELLGPGDRQDPLRLRRGQRRGPRRLPDRGGDHRGDRRRPRGVRRRAGRVRDRLRREDPQGPRPVRRRLPRGRRSTWSPPSAEEGQPDLAVRVVDVEVDQADALPRAEREPAAEHGHRGVRRHERRHHVRAAVPGRAVPVPPAVVGRQQVRERREQVVVGPGPGLEDRDAGRRVRDEHVQQPVAAPVDVLGAVRG